MRLSSSRAGLFVALSALVATFACGGGGEGPTGPVTPVVPPPPLVVALSGPASASATVTGGVGSCSYPLSAAATGGAPGASAQWDGGTMVVTRVVTGAATTQELTAAEVATLFQGATLATGQTAAAQRAVSSDRAFRVRHELRYRADGVVKSATHELLCDFAPVASVALPAAPAPLRPDQTLALVATPKDSAGAPLAGRLTAWSSSNTAVAQVSAAGVVTAINPGSATITATSEEKSGSVAVTVIAAVSTIAIAPLPVQVAIGNTVTATATVRDGSGNVLTGRAVTWATSSAAMATVTADGVVTGVGIGSGIITATSEGKSVTAPLLVVQPVATVEVTPAVATIPVRQTVALTAVTQLAGGVVATGRTVRFASADPLVASVDSLSGVVTGLSAGTATIRATSEGKSGTAQVTVVAPAAAVVITPAAASLAVGSQLTLAAAVRDSAGNALAGRTVTWTSSAPSVANVSATGTVAAIALGSATITASVEGLTATARIDVTAPAASISVAPASVTVATGSTVALVATVKDASGLVLTGRRVTWTAGPLTVATVDSLGVVRGVAVGAANVLAQVDGKSITVPVSVVAAVGKVTVTPNPAAVQVGDVVRLGAALADAAGTPITGRAASWTSATPAIATVNDSGVVTGVAIGAATIVAAREGVSASATVNVAARQPVASLTLGSATSQLPVGGTATLVATATDATGATLGGRAITWTSGAPTVATVSSDGVITGLRVGTATITATSEAKSATHVVTVVVPVAAITLTPPSAQLLAGATTTLVPRLTDASGATLTGRTITWTSSEPMIATVSSAGLVTGVAPGSVRITARAESVSADAPVEVLAPVATVTLAPSATRVGAGSSTTLTARLADAGGNTLGARPTSWTSSNTAVATVSGTGVVSGVAVGAVTITATSEGKSGTAAVTVSRPVATVTVSPATAALKVGEELSLLATVKDATGATLAGGSVMWTSSNVAVATVSGDGVVTGTGDGTATITASIEGKSGAMTVTATRAVAAVVMTPQTLKLRLPVGQLPGDSVTILAAAVDATGSEIVGRAVTWASSAPAIVSVSSTGLAVPRAAGTATITATVDGHVGSTEVTAYDRILYVDFTVPNPIVVGTTATLVGTPMTASGAVTGATVQWSSSNPAVASITSDGQLRGLSTGTATIEARAGDAYGSIMLTVGVGPAASITVTPATATILPSGSTQLSAVLRDAGGSLTTGTVAWSSSNPTVATVSATGIVLAGAGSGTTTITASSGGASGTAAITVAPAGTPVRMEVVPGPTASMIVRQVLGFGVNAYDANGARVNAATASWTSSVPAVATVDAAGSVTAVALGTTTITATIAGVSARSTLTVAAAGTIGAFSITPDVGSLLVGQQKQLTIYLRDAGGGTISPTPTVTWTSSAPSVATVSAAGLLTAVGSGPVIITAAIPGATATASFTMGRPAAFQVKLTPTNAVGTPGETLQMSATVIDNTGAVVTDRPITWMSYDPGVATVSASGLVTMRALGSTQISASADGAGGTATISVVSTLQPVARVVVTPARASIPGWQTSPTQLTAVAYNASGGAIAGRPVAWRSSNTGVVTVSASGAALPVSPGDAEVVATVDGVSGSAWLSIDQPVVDHFDMNGPGTMTLGEAVPFDVVLWDAGNRVLPEASRTITWSSSNPGVLAVTPTGVATAVAVGGAEVRVNVDGLVGSVYVRVTERADEVVRVYISAFRPKSMLVGDSTSISASYMTANGYGGDYGITWTSSNPSVATAVAGLWNGVPAGIVQGLAPGTALLTAAIGGKSDTITVIVSNPVPVASVTVTPNPLTLGVNQSAQLYATARDASGNVLNGRVATFTIGNSGVATITTGGYVVGRTVGSTSITVTIEGKSVTVPVSVVTTPPAIATITVAPTPVSILKGSTIQLVATARDATGTVLPGRVFTWSSNNGSVASVGGGGLVSGLATGTATIFASSGGISGSGAVTVTASSGGTGGTGGGSVCSSNIRVTTPAPGSNTGWIQTKFAGIDFMITAYTGNSGTSSSPLYQYTVTFRNRYTQGIWFSARGPSVTQPTDTQYAKSLGAGATGAGNSEYWNKPATLWVYIANVRLGSSTAAAYCE